MTVHQRPASPAIPGPRGLEHLRVMERAASYSGGAVCALHERYGPIFRFGFGPVRFVWLVGEEAVRLVLQERPESFGLSRAYRFLAPITGESALITSDGARHHQRRRLVQPAFYPQRLGEALALVQANARRLADDLAGRERVDLHSELRPRVLRTVCEVLLGPETLARHPALVPAVAAMMDFANLPFLAQGFKLPLPGTPWTRFLWARRRADALLYGEIRRRRTLGAGDGVLAMLLGARDEEGRGLSDLEVRDQSLSLLSAGFDTTSAALSWAIYGLLTRPDYLAALREELSGVPVLEPTQLKALARLDWLVKETLRLYPPAPAGLRQALEDVPFRGYTIAKGSLVAFSIYATHRQESLYPSPLLFKPERWDPDAPGYRPVSPYGYLPFGGGLRYCIGAGLATMTIKLFLIALLGRFRLTPAWTGSVTETGNTVQPKGGLPLRLSPL
ncbi:cytochrome P450 [soil metagenome]